MRIKTTHSPVAKHRKSRPSARASAIRNVTQLLGLSPGSNDVDDECTYLLLILMGDGNIRCQEYDKLACAVLMGNILMSGPDALAFDVFQTNPVRKFIPEKEQT